jgi:hypothetical protein
MNKYRKDQIHYMVMKPDSRAGVADDLNGDLADMQPLLAQDPGAPVLRQARDRFRAAWQELGDRHDGEDGHQNQRDRRRSDELRANRKVHEHPVVVR